VGESQRRKYEAIVAELTTRRELLTVDIEALERVQGEYRARLRAVLKNELEDLERRSTLPPPVYPDLHEVDVTAVEEPEVALASTDGNNGASASPSSDDSDGGPPTEALVVIDEEMAESGSSGPASRRRR
jgi:hypothetical protein